MTTLLDFDPDTLHDLCRPRYGTANPEKVENSFWHFMLEDGATSPWTMRNEFNIRSFIDVQKNNPGSSYREHKQGPIFCPFRLGRTQTKLPDGRIIYIAGEYEDFYDPDFCIYNDVIIETLDKKFEIYLYPKEIFPPTDFHTATLIKDQIYIIGSISYMDLRQPGTCPVYVLDIKTMKITSVETCGADPGWISEHRAEYMRSDNEIIIRGGNEFISTPEKDKFIPMENDYALMLEDMRWTCT